MPSKPIVTTAPSQQQNPSGTLPPLKQKTGIVKSKVPPPVPPRGSPKDRRGHRGASPKGTPSSGSYNHLNDKYFDACARKSSNSYDKQRFDLLSANGSEGKPPAFGDRRSPSCVEDWLELNNFDVLPPELSIESPRKVIAEHKRPISFTTKFLQRERSFHSIERSSSSSSVQSMVKSYAKPNNTVIVKPLGCVRPTAINVKSSLENIRRHLETRRTSSPNAMVQEIADLRRNSNVSKLLSNYGKQENIQKKIEVLPKITSAVKKHSPAPPLPKAAKNDAAKSVLASLRPARRKKRLAPRAEDIYCNSKEKQKILISLSNMELRSTDENYDTVIDSFSLEGEFV